MRLLMTKLKAFWLLASICLLVACDYSVTFEGESLYDAQGQEYGRLSWDITSADSTNYVPQRVTLEPGFGEVAFSGAVNVYPQQTTTYTMTVEATRNDGTAWNTTRSVTIHIGPRVNYNLFTDAALRACAQATGYTHIEQFKTLICYDKGIRQLNGVEQLTDLNYLGVDYNRITNFAPLQSLENLTTVSASDNGIEQVTGFPVLPALSTLVLSNNRIIDPSPLSAQPKLTHLTLDHNLISSASTLTGFTQLTSLFLQNNQIIDVGALAALNQLDALNLQYNGVRYGVAGLGLLRGIFALDLRNNPDASCLQLSALYLVLGPALLTNGCRFP